jgi:hypothetical protein
MLIAAGLTIAGVVLYRYNIVITGMEVANGGFYIPSWMEVWFMLGMGSCVVLAYLFIVENFSVYTKLDVAASIAARTEQEAERRAREMPPMKGEPPRPSHVDDRRGVVGVGTGG